MTSRIEYQQVAVTTTGGAGAATGNAASIPIDGFLLDVFIDYHASAPATTVVKVTDGNSVELLDAPAGNTDLRYAPRKQICSDHGVDTGLYDYHPIKGTLTVAVSASDALTNCVVVTLRWLTP
jgi:hypothetical protein